MVAASAAKAIYFLMAPSNKEVTTSTSLTPSWPLIKPNRHILHVSNLPRNTALFLSCCSTKPNTNNTDNEATQNSSIKPEIETNIKKSWMPSSDNPVSSHFSSSKGLIFELGSRGSWDNAEIGSPVVKRFLSDEEERWYMWYYGRSNESPRMDYIGLAISRNGIHWERGKGTAQSSLDAGLVMKCSEDWWAFDTQSIRPCEVVIMSSSKVRAASAVYWLYYTGYSSEYVSSMGYSSEFSVENPERFSVDCKKGDGFVTERVCKSLPGLAMSQDGRHWARIEGDHHSGALFDAGAEGEWDALFIAAPQVVNHGSGDLRMYYYSFDVEKGQFSIGVARSRDGMKWMKLGKIIGGGTSGSFDEVGVMSPRVLRNRKDGNYLMAYEGIDANGVRSIGLAVSPDGLKDWSRFQDDAILKPSTEDGWDNKGVGSPCIVQMDETDGWRLYYQGVGNGGGTGIGLAISKGIDISRFTRWDGFHLST